MSWNTAFLHWNLRDFACLSLFHLCIGTWQTHAFEKHSEWVSLLSSWIQGWTQNVDFDLISSSFLKCIIFSLQNWIEFFLVFNFMCYDGYFFLPCLFWFHYPHYLALWESSILNATSISLFLIWGDSQLLFLQIWPPLLSLPLSGTSIPRILTFCFFPPSFLISVWHLLGIFFDLTFQPTTLFFVSKLWFTRDKFISIIFICLPDNSIFQVICFLALYS